MLRREGATLNIWVFSSALRFPYEHWPRTTQTKTLAEKLKQIREALGLSQREMAERLAVKISSKNISKYERDKSVPFIEVVRAYSRLANVLMNEIVDDDLEWNL